MNTSRSIILTLALLLGFSSSQAQEKQDKKSGVIVLPAIFFSPETSLGFGVAGMFYFRTSDDSLSKPSNFQSVLIYTLENQVLITFPYNFFLKQDKLWLKGEYAYYIYPYQYYGIGSDVDLDIYEVYTADFLRLETNLLYQAKSNLYIGPTIFFDKYFNIEIDPNGQLKEQQTRGIQPGNVFGLGATFIYDMRNNVFSPGSGYYLEGRLLQYENALIGNYSFTDMYIDVRKYFTPLSKTELAFQLYHQSILGDPPFYNLALLGGGRQMRGYYKGGYRDNHQTVIQTEIRRYVHNRVLISAFGGFGGVSNKIGSYEKILGSYGVGLRAEINKKEHIRIRVDYARGVNTSGFYININEAF
ncbi:MAG: hypothetical protein CMP48_10625 [Rickettsiales bacterium]|nr:hypothetical protein [Rickettsiales bacterium]